MKPVKLEPFPARFSLLPVDPRGYPVPWFVAKVKGNDGVEAFDFRVMDPEKFVKAVKRRLCWTCGQPLGKWLAFGIGPMCAITRTISEPPSHLECMQWSLRNCPFLSDPNFTRDHRGLPADVDEPAGHAIMRNPGVICLWVTREYETFRAPKREGQTSLPLITIGEPSSVTWWREKGRPATRAEVDASIGGGMPALLAAAKHDGEFAVTQLGLSYQRALGYLPATQEPAASHP